MQRAPTALCHPIPLGAVVVLSVNDHLLKGSAIIPAVVTGKLSDVAGLFFFPILLFSVCRAAGHGVIGAEIRAGPLAAACAAVTALGFAAVNLWPPANTWVTSVWGPMVMDPTDLACLPMTALAYGWIRKRTAAGAAAGGGRAPMPVRAAAVAAAALASAATTIPPTPFPKWQIAGDESARAGEDVRVVAWGARTGKEGTGVVLRFDNLGERDRVVTVEDAELSLVGRGDQGRVAGDLAGAYLRDPVRGDEPEPVGDSPPSFTVEARSAAAVYIPFVFDNERAWNQGQRAGDLRVDLTVGGRDTTLSFAMEQDRYEARETAPGQDPPR